jgi:hypothetical protein
MILNQVCEEFFVANLVEFYIFELRSVYKHRPFEPFKLLFNRGTLCLGLEQNAAHIDVLQYGN